MTSQTPIAIVTTLLDSFAAGEPEAALATIDDDIVYTNVSLPTVRGKSKVAMVFAGTKKSWVGFDYRMINVSADGATVLTERIDEVRVGRLAVRFWVLGRFEIAEGRIVVWRDYFDWWDCTRGFVRGLLAIAVPAAQRRMPAKLAVAR